MARGANKVKSREEGACQWLARLVRVARQRRTDMKPPSKAPMPGPPSSGSGLVPGQVVGAKRYLLKKLVGQGGMGVVWLAHDKRLLEPVALKFLPAHIVLEAAALGDLRRETLRSRKLSHPNIVRIYDLYEAEGELPFISMEYVDGPDLHYWRARRPAKVLPWKFLASLVRQLCSALEYAHGEHVIHRDIKPANLMIDSKERLKLADFGLACVAQELMSHMSGQPRPVGTLDYMSPQQADGLKPEITDDIYSLGATLYELLTSQAPFCTGDIGYQLRHNRPQSMQERLLELGLTNDIPPEVSALVMACLAKNPEQRPQSAKAILEWLEATEKQPGGRVCNPTYTNEGVEGGSVGLQTRPTLAPETTWPEDQGSMTMKETWEAPPVPVPLEEESSPAVLSKSRLTAFPVLLGVLVTAIGIGGWYWFGPRGKHLERPPAKQVATPISQVDTPLPEKRAENTPTIPAMPPPRLTPPPPAPPADSAVFSGVFENLFNGRDLTGWEGDPRCWSVVNGAIVGRFTNIVGGAQVNTALFYGGSPVQDFELRFLFRGTAGAYNVLYRAKKEANFQALGYACTLWLSTGLYGGAHELLAKGTRGLTLEQYFVSEGKSCFKNNDWNEMVILVQSNRIRHELNGKLLCRVSDSSPSRLMSGALALALDTISSTGPNGIEFKDIRLKRLTNTGATASAPATPRGF